MSRIGKMPIPVPNGVNIKVADGVVQVKGPKGQLEVGLLPGISASVEDGNLSIDRANEEAQTRSFHGLVRSLLANAAAGVSEGWSRRNSKSWASVTGRRARAGACSSTSATRIRSILQFPTASKSKSTPRPTRSRSWVLIVSRWARLLRTSARVTAAGTLQGQGHPLRKRADSHQGRETGSLSMSRVKDRKQRRIKIKRRFRVAVRGTADRPRLSVYRSLRHVYAQVIDDDKGVTLVSASTLEKAAAAASRRQATAMPANFLASSSASGPRRRESSRWFSTAAGSVITVWSKPSPMAPAKRD